MVLLPAVGVVQTSDDARLVGFCMIDYQFCQCQFGLPCGFFSSFNLFAIKLLKKGKDNEIKNRRAEEQVYKMERDSLCFCAVSKCNGRYYSV